MQQDLSSTNHFEGRNADLSTTLRSGRDDKGEGGASWTVVAGQEPFHRFGGNKRAFCLYPRKKRRVPYSSLVFREMWDTVGLALKPGADSTSPHGCPTFAPAYVSRKKWAKPTVAIPFVKSRKR
jgi:hypothetical protein